MRLTLRAEGWPTSGVPDEWVALTVPGQFQTRFYTVRAPEPDLVIDIAVHDRGLVTEWAVTDRTGEPVTVTAPTGSFAPPPDAGWLRLVGDLTALPAVARILETTDLPVQAWVETPDGEVPGYLDHPDVVWTRPPPGDETGTAALVEAIEWPPGPGYLWMAGESAQMRAVRKHLMHTLGWSKASYDVKGYWRGAGRG